MSYSFSVPKTTVADFEAAASAAKASYVDSLAGNDQVLDQLASGQADEAIKAVSALVASGAVGTGTVLATINGHANPGHAPTPGWANDTVTISVSCADVYAPPAETTDAPATPSA